MGLFSWLRRKPRKSVDELLVEARELVSTGRHDDAAMVFARIRWRDHTVGTLIEWADAYLGYGSTHGACQCAAEALRRDPACAEALCVMGEALVKENRSVEGLQRFKEALRIDPACARGKKLLEQLSPPVSPSGQPRQDEPPAMMRVPNSMATVQLAELNNEAGRLYDQGCFRESIRILEQSCRLAEEHFGPDHLDTAACLNNLAVLYQSMGEYAKAEALCDRALRIHEKELGPNHHHTALSLNTLAALHYNMGEYAKAEPLYIRALKIFEKGIGPDHADTATNLGNLAILYKSMGDYAKAQPLYDRALRIHEKALGPEHPRTGVSLNNLAGLHYAMGDFAKAEPLNTRALRIHEKALGPDHPDTAKSLCNLADLYRAMSDHRKAEPLYIRALNILDKGLGPDHPDTATCLNILALLYESMGDYTKAVPLFTRALKIREIALGPVHPNTAVSLNNLAGLYRSTGDFAQAEPLNTRALRIHEKALGPDHPDTAASLNNLAGLYQSMGDFAQAEPLHTRALKIREKALGPDHPDTAGSLNNLAGICVSTGDFAQAEPLYTRALKIREKALGPDHPDTAQSLSNLAVLHDAMGDYTKAVPLCTRALKIREIALGPDHPDTAVSLSNLAGLRAAMGNLSDAMGLMRRATTIDDRLLSDVFSFGSPPQRAGFVRQVQGHLHALLSLALGQEEKLHDGAEAGLATVLRRKAILAEADATLRRAVLGGRDPALGQSLSDLHALGSQIAQRRLTGPGREDPAEHHRRLAEWESERDLLEAELARQIPEMHMAKDLQAADSRAVALALPPNAALVEFVRFFVRDFRAVAIQVSDQKWLPPQRWQPARYAAFVVRDDAASVRMIDLGEAEPIDRMIREFRQRMMKRGIQRDPGLSEELYTDDADSGHLAAIGMALRQAVFDPLLDQLKGTDRLLLSPDGDLTRLPFEILPTADGKDRLIDNLHISYVSVGRDLLRFDAPASSEPSECLVVADPLYDLAATMRVADSNEVSVNQFVAERLKLDLAEFTGPFSAGVGGEVSGGTDSPFARLPGTEAEGQRVASLLASKGLAVHCWMAEQALEERIKAQRSPRILHLSTHGFFLKSRPYDPNKDRAGGMRSLGWDATEGLHSVAGMEHPLLRSGLVFAGVNNWFRGESLPKEAGDGILTAEDVSGMDLLDTELVVLSACETGLGEVQAGEGVFGLRRAFVLAGARRLVMSLWKVPDQQTQELMGQFYVAMLAGTPPAEALRHAQLELKKKYPEPFYWGAFIFQGDLSPLDL